MQVVVPTTYSDFTTRRVLTTQWLDGEKLSQSQADDVGKLVQVRFVHAARACMLAACAARAACVQAPSRRARVHKQSCNPRACTVCAHDKLVSSPTLHRWASSAT